MPSELDPALRVRFERLLGAVRAAADGVQTEPDAMVHSTYEGVRQHADLLNRQAGLMAPEAFDAMFPPVSEHGVIAALNASIGVTNSPASTRQSLLDLYGWTQGVIWALDRCERADRDG